MFKDLKFYQVIDSNLPYNALVKHFQLEIFPVPNLIKQIEISKLRVASLSWCPTSAAALLSI